GSFGRRASDGGANLHIFHQQHSSNSSNDEESGWSQPGSREQLQPLQSGSSGLVQCAQSLNVAVNTATGDGNNNNSGSNSGNSDRRRRSGLSTVMQRPVINPELVMEVEARMNRAYLPSRLLPLRGSTLPHHRKSSLYHTSTGNRDFCTILAEINRHIWVTAAGKGELELELSMMDVVQTHVIPSVEAIDPDVLQAIASL
ncbi:PREDICTED: uncharacterized protein LOC105456985, partial [Wasmannia auropunctata]|uniref:uncharacterized protein LOC105456985 n=1 Tax=Wasmannia auropunctata TaxID=64793 RepID=UPI0005F01B2A